MAKIDTSWKPIYREFAEKLLLFKSDRKTLIAKIKKVFEDIKMKLPKLEENNDIIDIDPFTVFALFNKQLKEENRKLILKGIKKEFDLISDIPTGFDALPTLMPLNATFYWFKGGRGENDIQNTWNLYVAAFELAENETEDNKKKFCAAFDATRDQVGISWRITSGLFWVLPDNYFSLDSRNRWYVGEYNEVFSDQLKNVIKNLSEVPSGEQYLEICKSIKSELGQTKYHDYVELSNGAFVESERVNKENKEKEKQEVAEVETEDNSIHYWIYSPGNNASMWDECQKQKLMLIGWGEIGDLRQYASKNEIKEKMKATYNPDLSYKNDAHAVWEFANKIKAGDIIIVKKGMHKVIGRGIVESDYIYDANRPDTFNHIRKVRWTNIGEWPHPGQAVMKTLTDITQYTEYVQKLESLFESEEEEEDIKEVKYNAYTKQDFLDRVFMDSAEYDRLVGLLMHEQNIILQGAPGVGKTFIARKLAYSIIGEANPDRVEMVQFHQSYSYEDFVIGYRPGEDNPFELSEGIFYKFCKKAAEDDVSNPYFFVIDEINRGNLSKIFGELFMLVEKDKRDIEIPLLYGKRKFKIPKNVYIIGTMNTADRSLAIIDYALRRRFAFYTVNPKFDNEKFGEYAYAFNNEKFINLIETVKSLNMAIANDDTLGEGFMIGHSYFSDLKEVDDITLSNIVEYKLIQLLREYWFDEPSNVANWSNKLRSAIK